MSTDRSWGRPGIDAEAARAAALQDPSNRVTAEFSTDPANATSAAPGIGLPRVAPVIPGFEILGNGPVSAGGMGEIWKARRQSDSRAVAVKIPRPGADVAMFRRESESLRQLDHPHIVKFLEAGEYESVDGPRPYLVMELLFGAESITQYAWKHKLTLRDRLALFRDLCSAVAYLHRGGDGRTDKRIHRDLKPDNIRVNAERPVTDQHGAVTWPLRDVKLIDLGIAAAVEPDLALFERALEQGAVGTTQYMSPEQFTPQGVVDERSDIYALGVVLHELITGTLPYPASKQDPAMVRAAIVNHEIEKPSKTARRMIRTNFGISRACECYGDLEEIVLKALGHTPGERFKSVDAGAGELDLAQNIEALLKSQPLPMKRGAVYTTWMRARRSMRSTLAFGLVVVLATVMGALAVKWMPTGVEFTQHLWERSLLGTRSRGFEKAPVLIITYDDTTDYAHLAQLAGLPEVGDAASVRRVTGLLFERLANARPGVVMVDKWYGGPSEHDAAYLKGVEALRAVNRSVVVVADRWFGRARAEVESEISFSRRVVWGIAKMGDVLDRAWRVFAAQTGPDGAVWPSLAAAGVVHYERGPETFTYDLDTKRDELVARSSSGETKRISLTGIIPAGMTAPHQDLSPGTWVALYAIEIPPNEALESRTKDLATLMKLPEVEFAALVNRKIIVIGDLRGSDDRHAYADGRVIPGVVAHGVAAAQMLLEQTITLESSWARELTRIVIWAIVGMGLMVVAAVLAQWIIGKRAGRAVLAVGAALAAALLSLALIAILWLARDAYIHAGELHVPPIYVLTVLLAAALTIPLLISRIDRPWERAG